MKFADLPAWQVEENLYAWEQESVHVKEYVSLSGRHNIPAYDYVPDNDDLDAWSDLSARGVTVPFTTGLVEVTQIASAGGEGDGDQYWYVMKIAPLDGQQERYFKADGHYASFDGGEYDSFFEVFPKQVLRTEWSQNV